MFAMDVNFSFFNLALFNSVFFSLPKDTYPELFISGCIAFRMWVTGSSA